ncbi:hypothetical protein [Rhodoferax sp.]|uniref:hypothetical protein n=1 Tax=Rhodoferax sp. TaxID=50421 RepID=UPI00374D1BE4
MFEHWQTETARVDGRSFVVTTWKVPEGWEWSYSGFIDTKGVHDTRHMALKAALADIRNRMGGSD